MIFNIHFIEAAEPNRIMSGKLLHVAFFSFLYISLIREEDTLCNCVYVWWHRIVYILFIEA